MFNCTQALLNTDEVKGDAKGPSSDIHPSLYKAHMHNLMLTDVNNHIVINYTI